MNKFLVFILILIIAPFLGGLYGILHDQITYTISSEYYTKFKFIQFGLHNWGLGHNDGTELLPEIKLENPRFGAAIVGFLATWWVGLIIGGFLGVIGFIHRNSREMFLSTMRAICGAVLIALFFCVIGLLFGKLFFNQTNTNWYLPGNILDKDAFIMVGSMHDFSYVGGLTGMLFGVFYTINQKKKYKRGVFKS